jgi:prolyl-tRNA editing enzyme YbaK/EbsC (Cys-tRNA(Pro) deacylase)
VGNQKGLWTLVDKDLLNFPLIYAAAGTPNAIFAVSPRDLVRITETEVVQIKEGVGIS